MNKTESSLFGQSIESLSIGDFLQIEEVTESGDWRPIAGIPTTDERIKLKDIEVIVQEVTGFDVVLTTLRQSKPSYRVIECVKVSEKKIFPVIGGSQKLFKKRVA